MVVCVCMWCCVWLCTCVRVVKLGTRSLSLALSLSFLLSLSFSPLYLSFPFSLIFLCLSSFSSSLFFFFFSLLFLFPSLLLLLLLFLFFLLFSPPNTFSRTDQPTRRPTSRHLNVIWRRASAQQSIPSLFLSPPSSLHLSLQRTKKRRERFNTGIFPARNLFLLLFLINSKKSPPGKLQSLQFYINSTTIGL